MALWHRISSTKLGCLSLRCRGLHTLLNGTAAAPAADRPAGGWRLRPRPVDIPLGSLPAVPGSSFFGRAPARSFAAPVQAKPKRSMDDGPRINEAIIAQQVRLVTDEGHSIISRWEALDRARKLNLDLVEVQRTANPPVCKIMDFHREKFKLVEKEKERTKSKSAVSLRNGENKEVRFKAKTELKDLKIKAETVIRLMERGYRVKCTAMPKGKEEENLGDLLSRLLSLIEDVSIVESGPHVETSQAYVIVRHVKFTTKKSGKKISKIVETISRGVQSASSQAEGTISSDQVAVNTQHLSDAPTTLQEASNADLKEETDWSGFNAADNFEVLFGFDAEENTASNDSCGRMNNAISHPPSEGVNNSGRFHPKVPTTSVHGIPAYKPGIEPLKGKLELKKQTVIKSTTGFASTISEPSVMESNRYSKRSETKGTFQQTKSTKRNNRIADDMAVNQGRTPQQPTGYERDQHGQLDPQRQLHPHNPGSPSPGYRIFSSSRTTGYGDQSKSTERSSTITDNGAVLNQPRLPQQPIVNEQDRCKLDPKQTQVHPSDSNPGLPGYGIFSSPKSAGTSDQSKLGGPCMAKPSDSSLPSQSHGIFSAPKTAALGDQKNLENPTSGKPDNPSSPTSYGIFSNLKTIPSGDKRNLGDASVGKPRDPSPLTPSYGIFSTPKPIASGNQRNIGETTSGKPAQVSPTPRYGVFTATKTAAPDNMSAGDAIMGEDDRPLVSTKIPLNLSKPKVESQR